MAIIGQTADQMLSNFDGMSGRQYELEGTRNYEMEGDGYEGDDYDGYGDDALDFEGSGGVQANFSSEVQAGRRFSITLKNVAGDNNITNAVDKLVRLFASHHQPAGAPPVVTEGVNAVIGCTINGAPKSFANLQAFIKNNPLRVVGMKIESSHMEQIGRFMKISKNSPFRDLESQTITFSDFRNEKVFQDKIVTIAQPFQLDDQTDLDFMLAAECVTTITFYLGASLNTALQLSKKGKRAARALNAPGIATK